MNYELLNIGGTDYKTTLTEKFKNRRPWQKPVYNRVVLQMPGKITKIFITPGQQIKPGDRLFVYEAMKMRNVIYAQTSGTIKTINVSEGEDVGKNFVLAEME
ncbi:MAG: acetyl-CoA carboxylase biotin carboxyl carrier protein subunit [Bacteroidales bacterium]|nr:acetyl-CoA carboxylase biotin carboxyl carrier protein subunit [Bacteroidales bacterium]